MLFVILKKTGDSDEIWYTVSCINLLQTPVNVFHLTWIMYLHYLVKLEMLVKHVLPLSCYRKILQNLSHLNCSSQIRQIWTQFLTTCGNYCNRRCTKYLILILMNWNSDWERSGPIWVMFSLRQPLISGVCDISRSVMRVLYTFSCNIFFLYSVINWIQIWRIWRSQLRWDKLWSFFL